MELYLDLVSQPSRSVFIFAKTNNIPFDYKKISLLEGEQHGEAFAKINVIRKVPAIKDGDFCLSESTAIMKYMAEKFQTPDHWYPADLKKRARVNEYLSWQHMNIRMHGSKIFWLRLMIPKIMGVEVPKEKMDEALEDMNNSLNLLEEKFLQDKPFIAGEQISMADLVAIVEIMQPVGSGLDVFKERPKLSAWQERVQAEIGAELFDEAHQEILGAQEMVRSIDSSKLESLKEKPLYMYVCVLQKGYQDTDAVLSSVNTKVKGIALTNTSDLGVRIWDVADYIIPPQVSPRRIEEQEEASFFVLTNMIITLNQTQTHCPENPNTGVRCKTHMDCRTGYRDTRGNGVQTGHCVHFNASVKTCEVQAWCPLEVQTDPPQPPMLADAENFTVLIKNNIRYPKFNFSKRNILPHINKTYLERCVFNRHTDLECPIFRLKEMVTEAGEDFQNMAVQGGVMSIQISWNCDLDMPSSWCVPRYAFRRLDNKDPENTVAPGYNFRFAKYYQNGKVETRTLIKGYGIRFDVMVFGQAGKFNIVPTLLNIGAGFALLGVVTIICDWIVLTCMTKRSQYMEQKYSYVDDFGLLSNEST